MKVVLSFPAIISLGSGHMKSLVFNSNNIICVSVWFSRPLHRERCQLFSRDHPLNSTTFPDLCWKAIEHLRESSSMPKCWSGFLFLFMKKLFKQKAISHLGHWDDWWFTCIRNRENKYSSAPNHYWWAVVTELGKSILHTFLSLNAFVLNFIILDSFL